jgi:hypothetical protein
LSLKALFGATLAVAAALVLIVSATAGKLNIAPKRATPRAKLTVGVLKVIFMIKSLSQKRM